MINMRHLSNKFGNQSILYILLLALIIRLIFFLVLRPWDSEVMLKTVMVPDALGYDELAKSLIADHSFKHFDSFRTPGYPVFLSLFYWLLPGKIWTVLLVQTLISTFTVYIVFRTVLLFSRFEISLIAAFLAAIDLHQAVYSVALLTETLFVVLLVSSLYFLIKAIKKEHLLSIIASAFFMGLATLVRPASFYLPLLIILLISLLSKRKLLNRLTEVISFIIVFTLAISPWIYNNYSRYGTTELSTQTGSNLLFCNVVYTDIYKTGKPEDVVTNEFYNQALRKGIDPTVKNSFYNSKIYKEIAVDYIKANPVLYIKRNIMGVVNLYAGLGTSDFSAVLNMHSKHLSVDPFWGPNIFKQMIDFYKQKTAVEIVISVLLVIYLLLNYIFGLAGVYILFRKKETILYLIISVILYFTILTGVIGLSRLRLPFMPFINMLCAIGVYQFIISDNYRIGQKQ